MEKTEGESPPSKTCGSCRRVGTDLKICTACRSVHYCDVSCQKAHRKAHKDDCKEIAHAKEVMEEFKANRMTEECPICIMRLPMLPDEFYYHPCCGKTICHGCIAASRKAQGVGLTDPDPPCAFCRRPMASSPEELFGRINERINKHGDAMAVFTMGTHHREGSGVPKDDRNAFECDVKVSQMGNPHGMYNVAGCYMSGTGVPMDKKKARTYLEMAASNGHVGALVQLGQTYKKRIDKYQLYIQHICLAAESGHELSMETLKKVYRSIINATSNHNDSCMCTFCQILKTKGLLTKDDLAATIRTFHTAQGELRSEERDHAKEDFSKRLKAMQEEMARYL